MYPTVWSQFRASDRFLDHFTSSIRRNRVLFDPHEALASGRWGLTRVFSRRTRYIGAYKPISVSWYIRYSVHHVRRTANTCVGFCSRVCVLFFLKTFPLNKKCAIFVFWYNYTLRFGSSQSHLRVLINLICVCVYLGENKFPAHFDRLFITKWCPCTYVRECVCNQLTFPVLATYNDIVTKIMQHDKSHYVE